MKNIALADRVRHFKEGESGVEKMCEIMQKLADEAAERAAYENSIRIAKKLLNKGDSVDVVTEITELPREEVEAIAKRLCKLIA